MDAREAYAKLCTTRDELPAVAETEKINQAVARAMGNLTRALRRQHNLAERLGVVKVVKDYGAEFDAICQHPMISKLWIRDNYIYFQTKKIYIRHPISEVVHKIGKLEIRINTGIDQGAFGNIGDDREEVGYPRFVKISHIGKPERGRYGPCRAHPHVLGGGDWICFGNVATAVCRYIAEKEFAALIAILIEFVQTANVGDMAGNELRYWPIVKPKKVKRMKKAS